MKPKTVAIIGAILFCAIVKDEVVSSIVFSILVLPPCFKFAGKMLDGHAHPGKYSEK